MRIVIIIFFALLSPPPWVTGWVKLVCVLVGHCAVTVRDSSIGQQKFRKGHPPPSVWTWPAVECLTHMAWWPQYPIVSRHNLTTTVQFIQAFWIWSGFLTFFQEAQDFPGNYSGLSHRLHQAPSSRFQLAKKFNQTAASQPDRKREW